MVESVDICSEAGDPTFLLISIFLKNTYWQVRNSRLSENREFDRGQIRAFLQLGRRSHCMSSL